MFSNRKILVKMKKKYPILIINIYIYIQKDKSNEIPSGDYRSPSTYGRRSYRTHARNETAGVSDGGDLDIHSTLSQVNMQIIHEIHD